MTGPYLCATAASAVCAPPRFREVSTQQKQSSLTSIYRSQTESLPKASQITITRNQHHRFPPAKKCARPREAVLSLKFVCKPIPWWRRGCMFARPHCEEKSWIYGPQTERSCSMVATNKKWLSSNRVLLSIPVGANTNKTFLYSWIKTYSFHSPFLPNVERLDDKLAKCELGTGTALFMDDQPSRKSPGRWCVSTSSWDESPWCLLTGLIPLVREANQECSFAPNTCCRAYSIWPKWDQGNGG